MKNELLEIVVCPFCYTKLSINTSKMELICNVDNIIFPIKQGIPVLLEKQALNLDLKIIDKQ